MLGGNAASELPTERLRKTSAEQAILRNIQALESELSGKGNDARMGQLSMQIAGLRDSLATLQGPSYTELERENNSLKEELRTASKRLERALAECSLMKNRQLTLGEGISVGGNGLRLRLYGLLLKKYAPLINDSEKKTVGELKALIDREDLTVNSLIQSRKPENYKFERHYLKTARELYGFMVSEIDFVKAKTNVNFWLTPKEILAEKIGDDEDLAVFLCTVLYALGDEGAEVVIAELENLTTHAFVITEFNSRFILLDPSQKRPFGEFTGEKADVVKNYSFAGSKIRRFLYRFNHSNYEQFI